MTEVAPIRRVLDWFGDRAKSTSRDKWQAPCPAHEDDNPSLSIGVSDGVVLLHCHAGCETADVVKAMRLTTADLFPKNTSPNGRAKKGEIVATYDYVDENGELLFQVCRTSDKQFPLRHPDPDMPDGYRWGLGKTRRVLYGLDRLVKSEGIVFVVEGEKDCQRLWKLGLNATCNPMGAGKWKHVDDLPLHGRPVVLIPDNDKTGRDHVDEVAAALHGRAASVKVLDPLVEKPGGDVSDWLDAGNDVEDLDRLAEDAAEWEPGVTATATATATDAEPDRERHLTEHGNADRFVDRHGRDLLYCDPWGRWQVWDGKRWKADEDRRIEALAVESVRSIYAEAADEPSAARRKALARWAQRCETAHHVRQIIALARHRVPVVPDKLDVDPWKFNVLNGTLDLRTLDLRTGELPTGELRKHDRGDLITKLAPVEYDAVAECPRWLEFLNRIMAGNESLIGYLQRMLGMCLTGDVSVQELFIFWGVGANGKNTLLDTIIGLMGDYACIAPPNLLTAKGRDEHPTEIADLFGRRLVVASETDEGRRLRTSMVKQVTGDLYLKGRYMRQDFWRFRRTHKTVLVTNNKPVVRESTKAMWRRLQLVPFDVVIPEAEWKLGLVDELRAEWPGILWWLVQGCLSWQRDGLGTPEAVTAATAKYRGEQDQFQEFVDESCQIGADLFVTRGDVCRAFQDWAQRVSENRPLGRILIYERLRAAGYAEGYKTVAGKRTRVFRGIGLLHDDGAQQCTGRNNDSPLAPYEADL